MSAAAENKPDSSTTTVIETTQSHTFRIVDFPRERREAQAGGNRRVSDEFLLLGARWRLIFFPIGNNAGNKDFLSMFLEIRSLPPAHVCPMNFKMTVIHPKDPKLNITRDSSHEFSERDLDRGFGNLIDAKQSPNFYHANNSLVILVTLERPYPGDSLFRKLPEFQMKDYDSRKTTGYVGLRNQGATCYMNSLLQTLFHVPSFRESVYGMPANTPLQKVFYQLQTAPSAVSTRELTKSFGWDSLDAFTQHDVQEFARVLLDSVESKMKGTQVDGSINRLFQGRLESYIQCIDVEFKSSRQETYLDLQLNVKGYRTLEDSLDNYVAVEVLDGDNKYRAEKFGLQAARKGTRFLSFPPVLQLQLKRFEYDPMRDANTKVNDRFEFKKRIDLSRFVAADLLDKNDPPIYHLHSVLVHSGGVNGGHYYAFVRPLKKNKDYTNCPFYKFDDDDVHSVEESEALEGAYGGEYEFATIIHGQKRMEKRQKVSNAYMLVYIRESQLTFTPTLKEPTVSIAPPSKEKEKDKVVNAKEGEEKGKDKEKDKVKDKETTPDADDPCASVLDIPIPVRVRDAFAAEAVVVADKKKQDERAHLFMDLRVMNEASLIGRALGIEFDVEIVDNAGQISFTGSDTLIKVEKLLPLSSVHSCSVLSNVAHGDQQYWKFTGRENQTRRPNGFIGELEGSFESTWKDMHSKMPTLYVRDLSFDDKYNKVVAAGTARAVTVANSSNNDTGDRSLLVIKFFNVRTQTLTLLGSTVFMKTNTIAQVKEFVRGMLLAKEAEAMAKAKTRTGADEDVGAAFANLSLSTSSPKLLLWEEETVRFNKFNVLEDKVTVKDSGLRNGDLLLVQLEHAETEIEQLRAEHEENYEKYQSYLEQLKQKNLPSRTTTPDPVANTAPTSPSSSAPAPAPAPAPSATPSSSSPSSLAPPSSSSQPLSGPLPAPLPVKYEFHSDAPSYLRYLQHRLVVEFRSLPWRSHPDDANRAHSSCNQFLIEMSRTCSQEDALKRLAQVAKLDWERIRLTAPNFGNRGPGLAVNKPLNATVEEILRDALRDNLNLILYYQNDEFSFAELTDNRVVPIIYTDLVSNEIRFNVLVPKSSTVQALHDAVYDKLVPLVNDKKLPADGGVSKILPTTTTTTTSTTPTTDEVHTVASLKKQFSLRLVTVPSHSHSGDSGIPSHLDPGQPLSIVYSHGRLNDKKELRADVVAPEHTKKEAGDLLFWMTYVTVSGSSLYSPATPRPYGLPFVVVVKRGESWPDFKLRTAARLGIPASRAPQLEFGKLLYSDVVPFRPEIPLHSQIQPGDMIAIRDPEMKPKPSNQQKYAKAYNSRAIKIQN